MIWTASLCCFVVWEKKMSLSTREHLSGTPHNTPKYSRKASWNLFLRNMAKRFRNKPKKRSLFDSGESDELDSKFALVCCVGEEDVSLDEGTSLRDTPQYTKVL